MMRRLQICVCILDVPGIVLHVPLASLGRALAHRSVKCSCTRPLRLLLSTIIEQLVMH
jgi:hypothetical protein